MYRHYYCAPLPVKFTGASTVRINAIVAQLEAAAEIHSFSFDPLS
jgi:hypothetical protein